MPSIIFVKYFFMTLGIKIGDRIGARFTTALSIFIMIGSYIILLTQKNYYVIIGAMALFGMGDGLGNLSVINNGFKYFPDKKGVVNGVILAGMGFSSGILTPIADRLINPDFAETEKNGFYPPEVANRLILYIKLLIIIFACLGLIAIVCTFPFIEDNQSLMNNEENVVNNKNQKKEKDQPITEAFLSMKNLQLSIFCFSGPCK